MIKYSENVENRMSEVQKLGGIPALVPVPGPHLPRNAAPESLLRRVSALRRAAERVGPMDSPMESGPYGPPRADP